MNVRSTHRPKGAPLVHSLGRSSGTPVKQPRLASLTSPIPVLARRAQQQQTHPALSTTTLAQYSPSTLPIRRPCLISPSNSLPPSDTPHLTGPLHLRKKESIPLSRSRLVFISDLVAYTYLLPNYINNSRKCCLHPLFSFPSLSLGLFRATDIITATRYHHGNKTSPGNQPSLSFTSLQKHTIYSQKERKYYLTSCSLQSHHFNR